jgi:hypothetical protein
MPLFITAGKVRSVLQEKGVQGCVAEFGHRCGGPLLSLIRSGKVDMSLKKSAIEALLFIEEMDPQKMLTFPSSGTPFDDIFMALPAELRRHFLQRAFANGTARRVKWFFVSQLNAENRDFRKEVRDYIRTSNDSGLPATLQDLLFDKSFDESPKGLDAEIRLAENEFRQEFRSAIAEELVALEAHAAVPVLLRILGACKLHDNLYMVDRLVSLLDKLVVSGHDLEDILLAKLDEIRIGNVPDGIHMALQRTHCLKDYGWELHPYNRIIAALTRIGGKKTLKAMFKKFTAADEIPGSQVFDSDDSLEKAIDQAVTTDATLIMVGLMRGLLSIEKRLKASGELDSMREIEGYEDFMKKHGYR